jgi:hypothetical protein
VNKTNFIREGLKSVVGPAALIGLFDSKKEHNQKKIDSQENVIVL